MHPYYSRLSRSMHFEDQLRFVAKPYDTFGNELAQNIDILSVTNALSSSNWFL